jgi:tetratricopeptide (TPR) repeat protein
MRCPDCGYEVPEHLSLCPQCGQNVEQTQPMKRRRRSRRGPAMDETMPIPPIQAADGDAPSRPRAPLWHRVRVVLIAVAVFVCMLAISSGVGGYFGTRDGEATRVAERADLAEDHYRLGLERLDAGEFELALAEFEYALQLDPSHPLAAQGIAEAQARIASRPTPTPFPTADVNIEEELYAQGLAAFEVRDWSGTVAALSQLRAFAPEYETASVEEMLFTSLYNEGLSLLGSDRLEEGIFHLDQAQEIRPLDEAVLLELELARRYLRALGYWGVDWSECIRRFEELYTLAPGYKDVYTRLFQAYVTYGDLWAEQGEMCPAAAQYAQALELADDAELAQERDEAAAVCAVATPTPVPPITGTLITTGTVFVPDFQVGRLAYPAYNAQTGIYDIYALSADGRLTRLAGGADQPSWQWGTDRLIYRNRISPGISVIQPGGQSAALRTGSGPAWPTFSPNGDRYAYAARDASGLWQIYIARTDGTGEPVVHASGWEPIWGPAGLLAWTGCEEDGSACGIYVDNLDDDQAPNRLTGSINDSGMHWAPGGDQLAYMSDHTGSWNIYLLGVSGGIQVVTDDATVDALPAWAPDGSRLAFLSYRDNRWGIYLMQFNGEGVQKIIDLGPEMPNWENQRLSWAP